MTNLSEKKEFHLPKEVYFKKLKSFRKGLLKLKLCPN